LTKRSGSVDRTGATLLATVVLLLGVVALASRAPLGGSLATLGIGALGRTPRITRSPLGVLLVSGGAVVALFGLFVYQRLQMRLRRKEDPLESKPYRTRWNAQVALIFLPIAVGVLIILAGVFGSHPHANLILRHVGFGTATEVPGQTRHASPSSTFHLPGWVPVVLLGLLIIAAGLLLVRPSKRWTPGCRARKSAAPAVRAAVEESLAELRTDPDPRRAVVATYRRMEQTLAAAGLPRAPAEAPREYLTRALGSLELSAGPPSKLTTLFERAKFSLLAVDVPLRDDAIGALLAMQHELEGLA
jgi:uncharacterized membrane protein YidH (DUF202 family)